VTVQPELLPYQDEPAQLPSGAPGKDGYLRLGFAPRGGRTELVDLRRRAPLLVQQALHWDEGMPDLACVFMVSTSGGTLQGDRYAVEIGLAAGARAHVTTQSATKIQEMDANFATQTVDIALDEGAYLEYLPDPVIPYAHSRFAGHTRASVAPGATLLHAEIVLPGRKYYGDGELFAYDVYSSTFEALRPDRRMLCAEKLLVEPARFGPGRTGVMGGFHVFATVMLLTPTGHAERILARVPATVGPDLAAGASRLPDGAGLVYRVLGLESEPVRDRVRAFWTLVRREVVDRPVPAPFRWR
jgi:urease accessory protein